VSSAASLMHRARASAEDFGHHMRQRWYLYLPLLTIWGFAYARLFIDPMPRVPILFNWTASLPSRVAVLEAGGASLQRGDHVVFAFDGDAQEIYPGLRGQPFFKVVRGLPGDRITVEGRVVLVNGVPVGVAKTHTFDRRPLETIAPMVIPPDHFYVQGTSPDSFDSRYRASGLVRTGQVLGRVVPVF
jgi:conjugal transfer pilin signal peptidase TrbI